MRYSFSNLSSADFEDLVLDLIGREENLRFEAFCAGADGGVDGRHAQSGGSVIIQAKHYEGSQFSKLVAAIRRERLAIDRLQPTRYILATSCRLTPLGKNRIASIIGPSLNSESDIFGPDDINALLRKHVDVLKSHIKLWLSGAGVLDRVVRAAAHTFAAMTTSEIERKVRIYASNPSFNESLAVLERSRLLIISGPPGVGKTTLAEMLCYAFLSEGWDLIPIRSLDDGFSSILDSKKQIFLFDDFLGKVALDRKALAQKDSELARFMDRVRRSPNARFILTTRGYVLEEARQVSEYLGDERLDISKYVLDVGIYTRRIKARILYNHLLVSRTPLPYLQSLIDSNKLAAIVDHKNYNPRIIEVMTDELRLIDVSPGEYPAAFVDALNNPSRIWERAFRTHIDHRCRNLLIAMFFHSEYGVHATSLRLSFDALNVAMCSAYGATHGPKDFEECIRTLEGSFINIIDVGGPIVSYLNPSLRDYLSGYLKDAHLLSALVPAAVSVDWLIKIWDFVYPEGLSLEEQTKVAISGVCVLEMIETRPLWRRCAGDARTLEYNDAPNSKRIRMLMEWWELTRDQRFAESIMRIARDPRGGFEAWADGDVLIAFLSRRGDQSAERKFVYEKELLEILERALVDIVRWSSCDMLSNLVDAVDASPSLPVSISRALEEAVVEEFRDNSIRIREDESESSLSDRISDLRKFASRFGVSEAILNSAISDIEERIAFIEDGFSAAPSPSFPASSKEEREVFSDQSLRDLFIPLLDQ